MRILFATGNQGKLREIRQILSDLDIPVVSMKEAGIMSEAEENGATFEENALIKARHVRNEYIKINGGCPDIVLADDSGLEVDYLGKEPGVHSARYLGADTPHHLKNLSLIERLEGVREEERTARFVCTIAAVFPDGREQCVRETMEGRIAHEEAGKNGFGYDPIFYLPQYGMTSAEISPELKNSISHRGKALTAMKSILLEAVREEPGRLS